MIICLFWLVLILGIKTYQGWDRSFKYIDHKQHQQA